ncbi:MAG: hypothetical protein HQL60_01860 [Magnetococcales bacterium]|nr:hypothetical protein [Magnetococcales bacterium]
MTDQPSDVAADIDVVRQSLVEWWPAFVQSALSPDWMRSRERRQYAKWVLLFVDLMWREYQQVLPFWQPKSVQHCLTRHFMTQVGSAADSSRFCLVLGSLLQFLHQQQWMVLDPDLIAQLKAMSQQKMEVAQLIEWPGTSPQTAGSTGRGRLPRESSPLTDRLSQETKRIAALIVRDRPPVMAEEHMAFLESRPEAVFEILATLEDLFAAMTSEPSPADEALVTAYLVQLSYLLDSIRYDVERRYDWAIRLIADFQNELVRLIRDRRLSGVFVTTLFSLMNECKLTIEPSLVASYQDLMTEETAGQVLTPESFGEAIEQLLQEHGGDPFALCSLLEELVRAMPNETRSFALGESCRIGGQSGMSDAVALLILSRDASVRKTASESLLFHAGTVTPSALRRLIVMRNWLPENDRKAIDLVTRAARKKGVACAQWPECDKIISYHSMLIDGSGSHGVMIVSQSGRSCRWSAILTRQTQGFSDVWSEGGLSRKEINVRMQHLLSQDAGPVTRSLVDCIVRHHLHVCLEQGEIPPPALLQIAEAIGATEWLPQPIDVQQRLQALLNIEPGVGSMDATAGEQPLDVSLLLQAHRLNIMDSWFEDNGAIAEFLTTTRIRREAILTKQLLQKFYDPQRQRWAEMMIWAALWFQEQKKGNGADRLYQAWSGCLTRTAAQILDGQPLDKIELMLFMAQQTASALRGRHKS